jgi:hypothetical protein
MSTTGVGIRLNAFFRDGDRVFRTYRTTGSDGHWEALNTST